MKIKILCVNCGRECEHEEEGLTFDEAFKKYIPDKDELCPDCKSDLSDPSNDLDGTKYLYDMEDERRRDYQKDCGWPEKFKI